MKALLQQGDVQETFIADEEGKFHIQTVQDVEPILDFTKASRDHQFAGGSGDMQHVAEIPFVVALEWRKQGIDVFNPAHSDMVMAKINSPEYAYLRAAPTLRDPHIQIKGIR